MTLDEWKNLQEQTRPKPEFNIRKPESAVPSKAVVIHKSKYRDDVSMTSSSLEAVCWVPSLQTKGPFLLLGCRWDRSSWRSSFYLRGGRCDVCLILSVSLSVLFIKRVETSYKAVTVTVHFLLNPELCLCKYCMLMAFHFCLKRKVVFHEQCHFRG